MVDVKRTLGVVGILTWTASVGLAHEHWLDVEDYYPAAGAKLSISVCSGHSFPESSTVLKERVLRGTRVVSPEGKESAYQASEDGKKRKAQIDAGNAGVYLVLFELGPPQMKEPMYQAKAIVVAGDADDEDGYKVGRNLEIVPLARVSAKANGDTLPLALVFNGERVAGRITVEPAKGRSVTLSTTRERAAELKLVGGGRHLATASHKGKGCSLTFSVGAKVKAK